MVSAIVAAAITSFVALFPIVNPFGGLAVFFALTSDDTDAERRSAAARIALYVVGILVAFALGGSYVLEFFGISLAALRIAGGLIVAHTAWTMVTASSRLTPAENAEAAEKRDIAFTPMAMPMLAGPGSIGVAMALAARPDPSTWIAGIMIAVVAMGAFIYVLLRVGAPLAKRMGPGVLGAIDRILGFLILAIAIELIITGFRGVYPKFGI
ncbi:MAG: MarC family protein [Candidatus Eremiobacteraeota bacterium]|nr:MarC family protein [Candidatus Eremiobacteraeota bacterium]MBV8372063.1 MarC family protein [Candidatus Eremiobacteraeota bacterium]